MSPDELRDVAKDMRSAEHAPLAPLPFDAPTQG